jgi:hypothetical protein
MKFHKIWVHQCRATRRIKKRFGVESALDYLLGEKLLNFAEVADRRPEFAAELPRFQTEVWNVFNPYELAGYLTTLKPSRRNKLQKLLYVNRSSSSQRAIYTKSGISSRGINRRIDRACPGVRSRPRASSVKII